MIPKTVLSFLVIAVAYVRVDAFLDLDIKKYEMCPDVETPIKHHATITKLNATHMIADGDSSLGSDLGEDVRVLVTIERLKDGEWTHFKDFNDTNPCKIFNKYGGEVWYEIQEKVGVQKGVCPLPKGDYKVTGHYIDFTKLPIKQGPVASFRSKFKMMRGDELLLCMDTEIDSK